jgi:DNA-directed RNA polymerase beta subunit
MIQFKTLTQYTRVVDSIRFPLDPDRPFLLLYFSENSSFTDDYPKLNILRSDIRQIIVPVTKIPVTRLSGEEKELYKLLRLLPIPTNASIPKGRSLLFDTTKYTNKIDEIYKPTSYRQRAGQLIKNFIFNSLSSFPDNYQKIFVYSIDITKPFNSFINRKFFLFLQDLKNQQINYDHLLLALVDQSSVSYRLLVKDKEYDFTRVFNYYKRIKATSTEEEVEDEVGETTNTVMGKISSDIVEPNKIKSAVSSFVRQHPQVRDSISNKEMSDDETKRMTIASILYNVSGDKDKSLRISKAISQSNLSSTLAKVSKMYADQMLTREKIDSMADNIMIQTADIPKAVENKTPEHLFEKRKIDFETNLKKDLTNVFKVLENRNVPLKLENINIEEKPSRAGEIRKSDLAVVTVQLKDDRGKSHKIKFEIPKIDPQTGTFMLAGQKKILINQMILTPISFPKPYDSKFESSYSSFHIWSKRTKKLNYLEIYMGSFKLPLLILLAYSFGFETIMKEYGLTYSIVKEKPKGSDDIFSIVPSGYLLFGNIKGDLQKELAMSFLNAKVNTYKIDKPFLSKEYFNDLIIKMTGRVDSTYLITNNLDNIVDPVCKQILINQQLPSELQSIIFYMASKVVTGYVQDRNDITYQRVRNSELLVHLALKQLLTAYTEYKQQYLAGNEDAQINFPEHIIRSQFNQLELSQSMEYANPLEEMATITKVSPIGKTTGGIPDTQAVQLESRDVHPSYFGNIDPLDTSEGGNIGITQQLTVNAHLTSARGLFGIRPVDNDEKSGILSTSAAMIPFIENNDGNRIIMAVNQAKQMLLLKNPEPPIVQSGYESLLTNVLSDSYIKRSPCNGKVAKITGDYIGIICSNGKKQVIDITPVHLKAGTGNNTLSTFTPVVREGQTVKLNQIIAEGSGISQGTISLGRTLSVCYMPYEGYNFEDGIVINERLVETDALTSLHGKEIEAEISPKDRVMYIASIGQYTKKGEALLRKTSGEIDELLGYQEEENDEVDTHGDQIIIKSPGGKIVDIEVWSNLSEDKYPKLTDLIKRTNAKYKKPDKEKYTYDGASVKGVYIKFKLEKEMRIGLGDKLTNRYGGKGIISLIEKSDLMPRTPWGEPVDIILNPIGVVNRMNIGQLYELYCGFISKAMAQKISTAKNKNEVITLFRGVFSHLDNTEKRVFSNSMINNLLKLSDTQFKRMVDQIVTNKSVPIIVPPFQAPKAPQIMAALKLLGLKPAYPMYLPRYNTKTQKEVPFGYVYMTKLEHIGELKLHSRSTGPTKAKTGQPTEGKRKEGGQRMGEGDTWGLASYNATTVLAEFFGPMSDDLSSKNAVITDIIQTGSAAYRDTKTSPTRDLLKAYITAMMLGG